MHLPINRPSLIYSAVGVLAATAITASFLARLYLMRRRASARSSPADTVEETGQPGIVEELVAHNWRGF